MYYMRECDIVLLNHVIQAVQQISRGYRLPPPPGCHKAIYQLMINCWLVIVIVLRFNPAVI